MNETFLVLGGAGDMGSTVVSDIATKEGADIVIGDINDKAIDRVLLNLRKKESKQEELRWMQVKRSNLSTLFRE